MTSNIGFQSGPLPPPTPLLASSPGEEGAWRGERATKHARTVTDRALKTKQKAESKNQKTKLHFNFLLSWFLLFFLYIGNYAKRT